MIDCDERDPRTTSDPNPLRGAGEPDCGRRGRGTPGVRGQGAGGERSRCGREDGRHRSRDRRDPTDPGARRRIRDPSRGARARALAPCHQQDRDPRRPRLHREHGVSRRGAAEHRVGVATRHREPAARRRARGAGAGRRRHDGGGGARRVEDRDHGGGARPVLQRPGPAQVPAHSAHRAPPCRRHGAPPRPRASRRLVHPAPRWAQGPRRAPPDGARTPAGALAGRGVRGRARSRSPSMPAISRYTDTWLHRPRRALARTSSSSS